MHRLKSPCLQPIDFWKMVHVVQLFEPLRTKPENTSANLLIGWRHLPSYNIFVHCGSYSIKNEHFSILNYRILAIDTEDDKHDIYTKENSVRYLLFPVEFVMLFEHQINLVQKSDQFDYPAKCTSQDRFLQRKTTMIKRSIDNRCSIILPNK